VFRPLATTPAALHDFFVARIEAGDEPARTLVVCETCDAAGWVHDLAAALGFQVNVANCCHEAWRWNKVKRKTDRDDALKLAKMALKCSISCRWCTCRRRRCVSAAAWCCTAARWCSGGRRSRTRSARSSPSRA
jgi:hypothetical protein